MAPRRAAQAEVQAQSALREGKELVSERLAAAAVLWRKVIDALSLAAKTEAQALSVERETAALEARVRRASVLVEQTEARRARASAQLKELGVAADPSAAASDSVTPDPSSNTNTNTTSEGEKDQAVGP